MNIQISNCDIIEIGEENKEFHLTFGGDDGNLIQICNIKKKYLKQLYEDVGKILNKKRGK